MPRVQLPRGNRRNEQAGDHLLPAQAREEERGRYRALRNKRHSQQWKQVRVVPRQVQPSVKKVQAFSRIEAEGTREGRCEGTQGQTASLYQGNEKFHQIRSLYRAGHSRYHKDAGEHSQLEVILHQSKS